MTDTLFRYPEKCKPFRASPAFPQAETRFAHNVGMAKIDIAQVFTENVLRWRKARGMNQSELSKRSGVSNAHLSEVMHGESGITIELVADIAEAFGVEPWQLLIGSEFAKQVELAKMVWGETKGTNERVEQFFPKAPKTEVAPPKPKKRRRGKRNDRRDGQNDPRGSP